MSLEAVVPARVLDEALACVADVAARRGVSVAALATRVSEELTETGQTWLTVSEVAAMLAVDRRTVGRYREEKILDAVDVNPLPTGRPQWRIPLASVSAFLDACRKPRPRRKQPVVSPVIAERQAKAAAVASRRRKRGGRTKKHMNVGAA